MPPVWKAAATVAKNEGPLTQHEKFYISWKAFLNLNIIAKKGINSLNCDCYSLRAHTPRDTQSGSLKAEVKYSRHNSFLLGAGQTFEQLFEEQLEKSHLSLLGESFLKWNDWFRSHAHRVESVVTTTPLYIVANIIIPGRYNLILKKTAYREANRLRD